LIASWQNFSHDHRWQIKNRLKQEETFHAVNKIKSYQNFSCGLWLDFGLMN
jgi:hypothetical protein